LTAWLSSLTALWPRYVSQDQKADLPTLVTSLLRRIPESIYRAGLPCCVPSSLLCSGAGILTCCPSLTPFGLSLGPPNPTRIDLPSETLDLRRTWFSHVLRYSFRHSHFCRPQRSLRYVLYLLQKAPLPTYPLDKPRSFGTRF
jgi:hypothetical protein